MTGVSTRLKRGRHHNELTKFRYDVVLHVGGTAIATDAAPLDWSRQALSVDRLRRQLQESAPERLAVRGIPNRRLAADRQAIDAVFGQTPYQTAGELREVLTTIAHADTVDPETLYELGAALGYQVDASWSEGLRDGSFDVVFRRAGAPEAGVGGHTDAAASGAAHWRAFANNPLHGTMTRKLVPQIRAFVESKLPSYLMPSAFVLLESLPLSPNGKIDRRALPAPDDVRSDARDAFEAPRTPTEHIIAGVFCEVLGLDRVGVNDSFFQLGGHSLLATQVVSRIFEYLQVAVEVRTVFEQPTPAGLAGSSSPMGWRGRAWSASPKCCSTCLMFRTNRAMRSVRTCHYSTEKAI